jgi:hypothetical protein
MARLQYYHKAAQTQFSMLTLQFSRRTTGLSLSNITTCPVCKFKYVLENVQEQFVASKFAFLTFQPNFSETFLASACRKFSPVVVKVTFILLMYAIKGLIGIVASGYLAKLGASSSMLQRPPAVILRC